MNSAKHRFQSRRRVIAGVLALCAVTWIPSCGASHERVVRVYAATSLREVCEEVDAAWNVAHRDVRLVFNFAASDVLALQIMAGQRADVFLSADARQMDAVTAGGVLEREAPRPWLSNQLVVITSASAESREISDAASLTDPIYARISLGHPEGVPAGRYAKKWLENAGIWGSIADRIVPGVDVRAALAAVESGACEVGIVYSTDAAITERVRVVHRIPLADGPKIEYALAALKGPGRREDALAVFEFLQSPAVSQLIERRGFLLPSGR